MPLPNLSAVTDMASQPQSLIQQGQSLFQKADSLSNGDYAGLATAASGLLADLPSGQIQNALSELTSAGEGALAGAAIGSIIPGWGTAIGAVIGAIAGFVEGIVSNPPVIQGDPRPTSEQYIFPSTGNATPYSVIPYNVLNPRVLPGGNGPGLPFYQCAQNINGGLDSSWSFLYNFGVTWSRPPSVRGITKASAVSQQAAWNLCQWHQGVNSISKLYATGPTLPNQALIQQRLQAISQARITVGTLLGGDDLAVKAFNRLTRLYGFKFSTTLPGGQIAALNPSVFLWQSQSGDVPLIMTNGGPQLSVIANAIKLSIVYPLDFTYYMRGARYDANANGFLRDKSSNWNSALWFADPLYLSAAEAAILEYPELSWLHFLLGLMWLEKRGQLFDAVQYGPPFIKHHPNLARLAGIAGKLVREGSPKHKTSFSKKTASLTKAHKQVYTAHKTGGFPIKHTLILGGGGFALYKLLELLKLRNINDNES